MNKLNRKTIENSFWREVCETYGSRKHFSPGDYFVHSGEQMSSVGWIVSGCFKYSLPTCDGNSKTIGFAVANSILADYRSVMYTENIETDIIAIDESEVVIAPAKAMYEWLITDPTLHIKFIQGIFDQLSNMFININCFTPKQRYLQLLDICPQIMRKQTKVDVASYLNISQRQLMRLANAVDK